MTILRTRGLRRCAAILLALATLSATGCADVAAPSAESAPTSSMSPDPSPTPSSSAAVGTRVNIDGTGVSFAAEDGTVLEAVAFTEDPLAARARMTEWFAAEPSTTSEVSDHYCAPTTDPIVRDAWADAVVLTHLSPGGTEGYRFSVDVTGAAVGDIAVGTPQGFGVGDSPVELIGAIPGVSSETESGVTRVYYDQPDAGWSAYAWSWEGEPIQEIRAPYALEETC